MKTKKIVFAKRLCYVSSTHILGYLISRFIYCFLHCSCNACSSTFNHYQLEFQYLFLSTKAFNCVNGCSFACFHGWLVVLFFIFIIFFFFRHFKDNCINHKSNKEDIIVNEFPLRISAKSVCNFYLKLNCKLLSYCVSSKHCRFQIVRKQL